MEHPEQKKPLCIFYCPPDSRWENLEKYYRIQWESKTIAIFDDSGVERYEIDLDRCNTSAEVLNWIFQIKHKTWCTPEIIMAVLFGLDDAMSAAFGETIQGALCSSGQSLKVDWRKYNPIFDELPF